MKLSIPTSWDNHLIEAVDKINRDSRTRMAVHEVFGTLQTSITGGGRPASILPYVTREQVQDHIELAHQCGLEVNFLLNTICMGNKEFVPEYHAELLETLGWLDDLGVDTVTITIPYLMELVKRQFPRIKVCVSVTATVGTVQEARFFSDDLGVDRINVHFMINRNFDMIKALRKAVHRDCALEVLANDPCVFHCPYREYHQTLNAHGSQASRGASPAIYIDYPGIKCAIKRIQERAEILKSPWIRPEDTIYWERAGVDLIKLAGRAKPTDWIVECTQIYARREFEGNIYDFVEKSGLHAPEYEAFFGTSEMIKPLRFHIDNKSLDGFIDYFVKAKPRCELGCQIIGCRHCYTWAERVIKVDESLAKEHLTQLQLVLGRLTDSSAFTNKSTTEAIRAKHHERIHDFQV